MGVEENNQSFKEFDLEERRKQILEILAVKGKVKVSELSKLFNVSEVSIRNDLTELELAGALERTHGGAISTVKAYYAMSFNDRITTNVEEKRKIALEAAKLIKHSDSVIFSSGTTPLFVVREMKHLKDIKVVTNSVSIASEIGFNSDTQVILLGGNYNPQYHFVYGDVAIAQLKKYRADKLILSVDGVSIEGGITTYQHQESALINKMIEHVNTTIVVADHTKIGRVSFALIAPIEKIDILITDSKSDAEVINGLRERGIEVRIV